MKRFLSFFYTDSFKGFLLILIVLFSVFSSHYTLQTAFLYNEDAEAFGNVMRQRNEFNFETSYFVDTAVKKAIAQVLCVTLSDKQASQEYKEAEKAITAYKDFRYAVVNLKSNTISSNIKELNGKTSDTSLTPYFNFNKSFLIAVRNIKSPSFEKGTLTEYISYIEQFNEKYKTNFDLYIYFGESFSFIGTQDAYLQRNNAIKEKVTDTLNLSLFFAVVASICFLILITLTGKKEFGGKQYLTAIDKVPNDFLIPLYLFIIGCSVTLYRTSFYMLVKTTMREEHWLNLTPDFYIWRASISLAIMVVVSLLLSFSLKRQIKNKSLFTNTHIYHILNAKKK